MEGVSHINSYPGLPIPAVRLPCARQRGGAVWRPLSPGRRPQSSPWMSLLVAIEAQWEVPRRLFIRLSGATGGSAVGRPWATRYGGLSKQATMRGLVGLQAHNTQARWVRPESTVSSAFSVVDVDVWRSGTSRGPFLRAEDLPSDVRSRDATLLRLMGSGHPQQVDGVGGSRGQTSKVCIVGDGPGPTPSVDRAAAGGASGVDDAVRAGGSDGGEVKWLFAQCGVEEATVDWSHGDCGNMLAAVGPYSLMHGIAPPPAESDGDAAAVTVFSQATGKRYEICFPVDEDVDGVRRLPRITEEDGSTAVTVLAVNPHGGGTPSRRLLPTGSPVDRVTTASGLPVTLSVVDVGRVMVLIPAEQLGLEADDTSEVLAAAATVEEVRRAAALAAGLGDVSGKTSPKVALVRGSAGLTGRAARGAVAVRYWVNPFAPELHSALAMTAAQCIASAALVRGSVVEACANEATIRWGEGEVVIPIAHPAGVVDITLRGGGLEDGVCEGQEDQRGCNLEAAGYGRTVRRIMEGRAFIPATALKSTL